MIEGKRRLELAATAIGLLVALALGVYAQERAQIYLLVIDKAGLPVLEIDPANLRIEEEAGPGKISSVRRFGWPLKLTVLVDNGPGTDAALVHLRNGLTRLFEGIPRDVPVSLIATAPNPRWLIRDSKDLAEIKSAIGLLTPDEGLARFSDALGEYAARLNREFPQPEKTLPSYLPVLVSIATTHADGSEVLRERNQKMLLSLERHRVWTHMIMVQPARSTNEPESVSNIGVDEGQNSEIALLVQRVTRGSYIPLSSGATNSLATNILPALAQQIALRYLKQMTQHRVEFERAAGAAGPMKNFRVTLANHPEARLIISTDGIPP
jgi:hypothetical protein